MSISFSVYSRSAFEELHLPVLENEDYELWLRADRLGLDSDIRISFEVLDGRWYIKDENDIKVYVAGTDGRDIRYAGDSLKDKDFLRLVTKDDETISLIVKQEKNAFRAYGKFDLSDISEISIGRDDSNDIVYDYYSTISMQHAKIVRDGAGFKLVNLGVNGTYVNQMRISSEKVLEFGDYINVLGLHIVFLGDLLAVDVANENVRLQGSLRPYSPKYSEDEGDYRSVPSEKKIFRRSPRSNESIAEEEIEIEAPPQLQHTKQQPLFMLIGPSVTMALPMILGCILMVYASGGAGGKSSLYMYSGLVMSVSSALVGVIWTFVNIRYQKSEEKKAFEGRLDAYGSYLIEKTEEIRGLYDDITKKQRDKYPSAEVILSYSEQTPSLWNRNQNHDDFIAHRLGIGDMEFPVRLDIPKKRFTLDKDDLLNKPEFIRDNYKYLSEVPITVNLMEHKLIGLVGGAGKKGAYRVAKLLAAQIAASNCYTDVKMAFLIDEDSAAAEDFGFARWFPHVWSEDKKRRYVAYSKEDASEIFYELTKICRSRADANEGYYSSEKKIPKPYYIIFVSDPSLLEGELLSKYIKEKSEVYGITTLLMTEQYEQLPNQCEYVIENTNIFSGMYDVYTDSNKRQVIAFDAIDDVRLERFARKLSGVQVIEVEEGGDIPEGITFFDMLGIHSPEEFPVRETWAKSKIYENIRGQVGVKAGGSPLYLDVHEKYHGPHGLVAGTTGSGKSETLQTYMLSLAVNYSPDDIGFFIIDYKGGGMANLFEGLPHMIGQISNLSGNQVRRAMISIKSENQRRQSIFNASGVNNINAYTRLYKSGDVSEPICHMFIIIDEFAELKREEPDFMRELISVAQVGRSLGVHLILATQKPSGTVDENIWSNTKFRLCLRVADQQDSKDMLHKPDAAFITQAGRCYLQVGNDEIYELFQSGYSGASYSKDDAVSVNRSVAELITTTGHIKLSGAMIAASRNKKKKTGKEVSQLDAMKEELARVAKECGYKKARQLWMPLLAENIYLDEFDEYRVHSFSHSGWSAIEGEWRLPILVGKIDDPENQRQLPLVIDFERDGHVAIVGNIVSGKSTLMQTIAYSLMQTYTPEYVNMYALDFSSNMMSAFENSPHFGGVIYDDQPDKIAKFFNMIEAILQERKEAFRGGNYKQYVQVHGVELPAIIVFIDNYGSFKEKTNEAYENVMIRLSKEGISHGIYLVISGGGYGMNDITSRVGENIGTVLTLALQDRFAYSDYMHTTAIDVIPESGVKGRGLISYDGRVLEYQAALSIEAQNDYDRQERIARIAGEMSEAWQRPSARGIPEIPKKPVWSEFSTLAEYKAVNATADRIAVGYDSDNASVYGISLAETYCYLVCGHSRTGKTNMMKAILQAVLDKEDKNIWIMDFSDGEYRQYQNEQDVFYADTDEKAYEYFSELLPVFKERNQLKNRLLDEGKDEEEIYEAMRELTPYFIFLSRLDDFIPAIYESEIDMKGFLANIISKGRLHNIYFFGELDIANRSPLMGYEIYDAFIGHKTGVHFGGKVVDNPMLSFEYLSYAEQGKSEKPGVGMLPGQAEEKGTKKIIVPLARR